MIGEKIENRKIVPIIGTKNSGKSELLNTIFNFDLLESGEKSTTNFVNILRYNPNIKESIFYHLKIEEKNKEYFFYKDFVYQTKKGIKTIKEEIRNINRTIKQTDVLKFKPLNNFYMTEINEVEFIKDKKYLLNHDFCDMPGYSIFYNNSNNGDMNEEKKEEKNDGNYLMEILKILKN